MTSYNIDSSFIKYTNDEVFQCIKYLLREKNGYDSFQLLLFISDLICYISDADLLNNTVQLFIKAGFLSKLKEVNKILVDNHLDKLVYSEHDCNRIRALVYGPMLTHEVITRVFLDILKNDMPEFRFGVNARNVSNNVDELVDIIRKRGTRKMVDDISLIADRTKQKDEIDKLINNYASIDYKYGTETFNSEIKYLKDIRDYLPRRYNNVPSFPFTKIGIREKFEEYVKNHVSEALPGLFISICQVKTT